MSKVLRAMESLSYIISLDKLKCYIVLTNLEETRR